MKKKLILLLTTVILIVSALVTFAGCSENKQDSEKKGETDQSDYEFVFVGSSSEFNDGRELNVSIYGNKDEGKTFNMRVKELPQINIKGKWVFVENKGYKLYFEDGADSYVYSSYDTTSKNFGFTYTLNCGEIVGSSNIKFAYKDEKFANTYDGIGLGKRPPVFDTVGIYALACGNNTGKLSCNEDGTFIATAGGSTRKGTWTYDEDRNEYTFNFEFDSNYNEGYKLDFIKADGTWGRPGDGILEYQFQDAEGHMSCFNVDDLKLVYTKGQVAHYDEELDMYYYYVNNDETTDPIYYQIITDEFGNKTMNPMPICKTTYDETNGTYTLKFELAVRIYDLFIGTYKPLD